MIKYYYIKSDYLKLVFREPEKGKYFKNNERNLSKKKNKESEKLNSNKLEK